MDQSALRKSVSERAFAARHGSDVPPALSLNNPLPDSAHAWLQQTAERVGASRADQQHFAGQGLLKLDALQVVLVCQHEAPVPLWLLCGFMRSPEPLAGEAWHQVLIRAAAVSMSMQGIALGVDGNTTLLCQRLPFDRVGDADALAAALCEMNTLAASLVDLTLSAAQPPRATSSAPPSPAHWVDSWHQQLAQHLHQLALQSLQADWHHALLTTCRHTLGLPASTLQLKGVLAELCLPERHISLTADGDGRHLLITLPLSLPHLAGAWLEQQLQASQPLYVMTHCSVALSAEQPTLHCRWDSLGLDGEALAHWLADMMTLAIALEEKHG